MEPMYMREKFGAWQVGDREEGGAIQFKLFFPDREKDCSQYAASRRDENGNIVPDFGDPKIESIQVAGDFQRFVGQTEWDFEGAPHLQKQDDHPKGWVWAYQTDRELPAGFYQYKYYVTFQNGTKRIVGDPCSRYGGSENQNSALVVGGSNPTVTPLADRKHLRDLVVYELMIDDFTDEYRAERAPLDAVRDKLPYLKDELGINAILCMPWTAWPGYCYSWGYTPYQYFSVEYRYANAEGKPAEKLSWLMNLISACHDRGIHVFMDGVFNHVGDVAPCGDVAAGFPYLWLYQNPDACPYVGQFGGRFPGLKDLDFNNGCTQAFIRDVCLYWIDDFKIDGIRFDNTSNFYVPGDQRGLPQLLKDVREHVEGQGQRNFALILEHLALEAAGIANETGATSYWNNELYQRCFDYLWRRQVDSRIMGALDTHVGLGFEKVATVYLSNHDHSHVTWQAGACSNAGALEWYRTQPYAIALLTCPGAPMIQNGQEFGEDHWIMEDDQGMNRRVRPRPLRWDFVNDRAGSRLLWLYSKLTELRNQHPSLRSDNLYPDRWETWQTQFNPAGYGVDVEKQVVIYHRWGRGDDDRLERFIVVLNCSPSSQCVDIPFSTNGEWQDVLNGRRDTVTDYRLGGQWIESNWGRVYLQRE